MFSYKILAQDGAARVGEFTTPHGVIRTPVFMPVGTHGAVKGVSPSELTAGGSQIILGNTYHLYLRPGDELIANIGGLHAFMGWQGPILTDSGGFQVFSLGERHMDGQPRQALRKIAEKGITFQSHLDGSRHMISPEVSLRIQHNLGADIIMAFDQPVYGASSHAAAREAMQRSQRWLERSKAAWQATGGQSAQGNPQALFGIVQGGVHTDLHTESIQHLIAQDLPGNAIGGLSVGEDKAAMWAATASITSQLPAAKPRYFMGLGDPADVWTAINLGVDMMDCVAPSRLARHGAIWQLVGDEAGVQAFWDGDTAALTQLPAGSLRWERWNLLRAEFTDSTQVLPTDEIKLPLATLHHYLKENEMLGYRILTQHNIRVLHLLTQHAANAITAKTWAQLQAVV